MGTVACGILADKFGRKLIILVCVIIQALSTIPLYFAPSIEIVMLLRFAQGLCFEGILSVSFTLQQELTPPRVFTVTGLHRDMSYVIGSFFIASISYFVLDWRTMLLYLEIPTVMVIFCFWAVPESPTW